MTTETPTRAEPQIELPGPDSPWGQLADEVTIARAAEALRVKGYEVHVVDDAAAARAIVESKLPDGAEVSQGASNTLQETGITELLEESGRYNAIRPKTRKLDYTTEEGRAQGRKMGASPDWWLNSVHAITEDGRLVIASNTGSQLGPIAFGAGSVIFVAGTQKIVPDLDAAFRRIEDYIFPFETERMMRIYGRPSHIGKLLVINQEVRPGRFTVILVREKLGF